MFSSPERCRSMLGFWKMIPMLRRTAVASRSRSWPAMVTVPSVFDSIVVRIEMVVVFPAPFGPRNAKSSPGSTSKLTSSTAATDDFLYRLVRCWTRIMGSMATSSGWIVERPWRRGGDPVATGRGCRPISAGGRSGPAVEGREELRDGGCQPVWLLHADHVGDVVPDERAGVGRLG